MLPWFFPVSLPKSSPKWGKIIMFPCWLNNNNNNSAWFSEDVERHSSITRNCLQIDGVTCRHRRTHGILCRCHREWSSGCCLDLWLLTLQRRKDNVFLKDISIFFPSSCPKCLFCLLVAHVTVLPQLTASCHAACLGSSTRKHVSQASRLDGALPQLPSLPLPGDAQGFTFIWDSI